MAFAWGPLESIATAGGTIVMAFGLFAKSQRDKGVLEQKVKDLDKRITDDVANRLHDHDVAIISHTATLAEHEGSFKVIDTKLDALIMGQEKMDDRLRKHCEERQ
jgi:hypothetical protein